MNYNPNYVVPDRPAGDSSDAAANTRFVGATLSIVTPERVIPPAIGDGVADDTAAMVAFFAAAAGKIALLRPGATYLTDPIVITSANAPAKIWANGATLKARAVSTSALVTLQQTVQAHNSKFYWEGGLLNANSLHAHGLKVFGLWYGAIENVEVTASTGDGIWIDGATGFGDYYLSFTNCGANNCGGFGWLQNNTQGDGQNYINSNSFIDCTAVACTSGGWSIDYSGGTYIDLEAEICAGPGVTINHTWDCTFVGGFTENNFVAAVDVSFAGNASNTFGTKIIGGRHIGNINNIAGNPNCVVAPNGYQGTSSQQWATAFNVEYLGAKGIALAGTTPIADGINYGANGLAGLKSGATQWQFVTGLQLGAATGGDPGLGKINVVAAGYQVNGAALAVGHLATINGSTVVGNNTGSAAAPAALTVPQVQALIAAPYVVLVAPAINFNSANTDTALTVPPLPAGFTRFKLLNVSLSHASHDISTATFDLRTASAGGGASFLSSNTVTLTQTGESTNLNAQGFTIANQAATSYLPSGFATPNTIYARVLNAEGAAATADLTVILQVAP